MTHVDRLRSDRDPLVICQCPKGRRDPVELFERACDRFDLRFAVIICGTQNDELVADPAYRAETMRDDERSDVARESRFDRGLNGTLRGRVERTRRLVDEEEVWALGERGCDHHSLRLSTRELDTTLPEQRVEPVLHTIGDLELHEQTPEEVVRDVRELLLGEAVGQVEADRPFEDRGLLRDVADTPEPGLKIQLAQIDPIHQHFARFRIKGTLNEAHDARLARTTRADERHSFSLLHRKAYSLQHRTRDPTLLLFRERTPQLARVVGVMDILQLELDAARGVDRGRVGHVRDLRRQREPFFERTRGGHVPAELVLDVTESPDVVENGPHPDEEREDLIHSAPSLFHRFDSLVENEEEGDGAEKVTEGRVTQKPEPELPIRTDHLTPARGEVRHLRLLVTVGLHTFDVFPTFHEMAMPAAEEPIERRTHLGYLAVQVERPQDADDEDAGADEPRKGTDAPESDVRSEKQEDRFDRLRCEQVHALERTVSSLFHAGGREQRVFTQMLTERLPEKELVGAEVDRPHVLAEDHLPKPRLMALEKPGDPRRDDDTREQVARLLPVTNRERSDHLAQKPGHEHRDDVFPAQTDGQALGRRPSDIIEELPPDPGIHLVGVPPALAVIGRIRRLFL